MLSNPVRGQPRFERDGSVLSLIELEPRQMLGGDPFPSLGLLEDPTNPVVEVATERGSIFIELLANEAPNTVAAFLGRMEDAALSSSFFHRLEPGVALEGGTWFFLPDVDGDNFYDTDTLNSNALQIDDNTEGGRANTERTIAATWRAFSPVPGVGLPSQMVFNLGDNTITHPSDQYVVFARVIDDASWAIVQGIAALPVGSFGTAPNVYPGIQTYLPNVPLDESYTPGEDASPSIVVQIPEIRLIRAAGAPDYYRHVLYSAEGFTGSTINEFIPIVNPNGQEAFYEIRVRYERSTVFNGYVRDDLVTRGAIAANSRGGVTVSTPDNWWTASVLPNRPYAIEIWSTLPVAANFSHYDFGIATGEAFISETSTSWFLGDIEKNALGHDFLLWYNPGAAAAEVTLTFINESGIALDPITFTTEAFRRGGINISETSEIPMGRYTVRVESTEPIIASHSHYGLTGQAPPLDGFGTVGQAGAPSTVGVIPIAAHAGQTVAGPVPARFRLTMHNPGATSADVAVDFYLPGATAPAMTVNTQVAAGAWESVEQTLAGAVTYIAVYRSTQPLHASHSYLRADDSYSAPVSVSAATSFHFAEGFTDPERANVYELEEHLTIFNPFGAALSLAPQSADIAIRFRYTDGHVMSVTRSIAGGTGESIRISELSEVIDEAMLNGRYFYSIELESSVAVVAQFMHTDRRLGENFFAGGGFSSLGTIFGDRFRLDGLT